MAVQLVEPETPGEEISEQTGGGHSDAPDEKRVTEILPYPINSNKSGTKPAFPGSTLHRTV